jgi:hypothetical protein
MGNMICCATIERLEETHEEVRENAPTTTIESILREMSNHTLFPTT